MIAAGLVAGALALPLPSGAPARLLVTADEWVLVTSRPIVAEGRLDIQLYNRGEDVHDLVVRRRDGTGPARRLDETRPGGLAEARWRMRRGRYQLWCSLRGHRAAGMRASLRVR